MKKFLTVCLFLSMCLGFSATAFAAESQYPADEHSGEICITVNSDEELAAFEADLKEKNARAQKLWEQAVQESYLPENQMVDRTPIVPYAETVYLNSITHWEVLLYNITFEASYTKTQNTAGATVIGSVKNITAYMFNSKDKISILNKSYKLIDAARTIAANYSCRISVYNQSSGTYHNYSKQYYVEFYVGGTAKVY